ncbi:MAG: DUF4402 domain-containing protein [Gemmatimonadales bacterium]
MRVFTTVSAGMVLALSLGASAAFGQTNSASITATALVQQPINVTGAVQLDFGRVFPGVNKSVVVTSASAGRFDVTGQASAPANLSFVLPATLTSAGNNLPIGSWAGHWNTTNNATTGTNFTPSAGLTPVTFSGTGGLFTFVGGTVTPAVSQAAGTYTGTVTLTVTY